MIERTVISGGEDAWREGYCNIPPLYSWHHDEWYWESWRDGQYHRQQDEFTKRYRQEAIERMKALRAKFKAIKAKR